MIATMKATSKDLRPADQKHGYVFGCDGLLTIDEACDWLKVSRYTLDRLCSDGFVRKGKSARADAKSRAGRVYICKRSVDEYVRSMEVSAN